MSRDATVTLPWGGDEEVTFRLGIRQWEKVQERCDAGPPELYRRLIHAGAALSKGMTLGQATMAGMGGEWRIHDVREVIVQGLVGGGRADLEARALVQTHVDRAAELFTTSWGDEAEVSFRLGFRQWEAIQGRCDAGPAEIYRRLIHAGAALDKGLTLGQATMSGMGGDWRIRDVREVICQGLVGGGMPLKDAADLVADRIERNADFAKYVAVAFHTVKASIDNERSAANVLTAFQIVRAGLGDVSDEALGEPVGHAAAPKKRRSRGAKSGSRRSTATAS